MVQVKPLLLLSPGESRDRDGVVTPTITGGVRVVDGEHGKAWQVAEAGENIFRSPIPMPGLPGWMQWASTGSILTATRVDDRPDIAPWCFRVESTTMASTGHSRYAYLSQPASGSSPVTPSLVVAASRDMPWATVFTRLAYTTGGNQDSASVSVPLTTAPQRVVLPTMTPDPNRELTSVQAFVSFGSNAQSKVGDTVWLADGQIERKTYATPFMHGDMGPGFSWAGTPHESSSKRSSGQVSAIAGGVFDENQGAVFVRARIPQRSVGAYPFSLGYVQGLLIGMHSQGHVNGYLGPGVQNIGSALSVPDRDTSILLGMEWDEQNAWISYQGVRVASRSRSSTTVDFGDTIALGRANLGDVNRDTDVESVVAYDRPLTENERPRLMGVDGPWTWDELTGKMRWAGVQTFSSSPGSIDVVASYDMDINDDASATLRYRRRGWEQWRVAAEGDSWKDGERREFATRIEGLTERRAYDIEMIATDPDGASGDRVLSASGRVMESEPCGVSLPEPLLLLSPQESRGREGYVRPTVSGGAYVTEGVHGHAWQVWEAGENLIDGLEGVPLNSNNNAQYPITYEKHVGMSSVRRREPFTHEQLSTYVPQTFDLGSAATVTTSVEVMTEGEPLTIGLSELASERVLLEPGEWVRIESTKEVPAGTAARPDGLRSGDAPLEQRVYYRKYQFEVKPYATPFMDGSRAAGSVFFDLDSLDTRRGSVVVRYTPRAYSGSNQYVVAYGQYNAAGNDFLGLSQTAEGSATLYAISPGQSLYSSNIPHSPEPAGSPAFLYMDWDGRDITIQKGADSPISRQRLEPIGVSGHRVYLGNRGAWPLNGDVESAVFYDRPLTEAERMCLRGMDGPWTWLSTGGSWEGHSQVPAFQSSIYRIVPRIYEADRTGELGREITNAVTDAVVDADIDRAGPKGRIEISSRDAHTLQPNMWVAPFLNIRSEGRDEIDAQMGLYQLNQPSVTWDGMGDGLSKATGDDPVKIIQQATLETAQITHRNISVMGEVRRSIQIATMAKFGENIFPYTYDRPKTDWGSVGSDSSGWIGTDGLSTVAGARPRGDYSWFVRFDAGCPAGGYRYLNATGAQFRFPVPEGARSIYASHYRHLSHPFLETKFEIRFYTADGTFLSANRIGANQTASEATGTWLSHIEIGDIPPEAVMMGVLPMARTNEAITAAMGTVTAHLGGFEVGVALGEPVRTDALPSEFYSRSLASAMTHEGGTSWLERINDLLTAIGLYGLNADNRGRYTTSELRDLGRDTPLREYELGVDSRVVGEVETDRIDSNFYNRVIVIREDYETKTAKIAVASNDDHESPYSTVNRGVVARVETVTDSTQDDALQALAESILARSSMQENIKLGLVPDPELTVYDIIEVLGDAGPRSGRWSIESWSSGLTSENPMVKVGARRTLTGINR